MHFPSKTLLSVKHKINGKIKKAIESYDNKKVKRSALLTDYLAVKSKGNELAEADNPFAYFYKGIEGYEIETGVSHDETLFRFAAMTLKDQNPSDVIRAAFYSNKKRDDSNFEIGYLLPLFMESIRIYDRVLVVNPSPNMICFIEESIYEGERYYAVTDKTVADLYRIQFSNAQFITFDQMNCVSDIDAILITNRDQNVKQAQTLIQCLSCCKESALVVGLIPCAWLDNPNSGVYKRMKEAGFSVKQLLLVDSKATSSTPRKKMIILLDKYTSNTIEVYQSSYDTKARVFSVADNVVQIQADSYLESDKTILYSIKSSANSSVEKKETKYRKAVEYKFSDEISLFYRVYPDRKNKFAGVAYYREIDDVDLQTRGKKLSPDMEKGLRADSKKDMLAALERTVFDDDVYYIIHNDLKIKYIAAKRLISLKTIWFYCWIYLIEMKKYDHEYASQLFIQEDLSMIRPQIQTGAEIIKAIAKSYCITINNIPYKAIEQIDLILKTAVNHGLIVFNSLEPYVLEYAGRATERQQDVRNALVKKHFSSEEEMAIFVAATRKKSIDKCKVFSCTYKSILLAAIIRLFTGMAIREVAALNWDDLQPIKGTSAFQFTITKFVDSKGKIILHSERDNWKRFRVVPSASVLSSLLNDRKQYLLDMGIDKEYLGTCPIVLQDERIADMLKRKPINHCKPEKISEICNSLIKNAKIPENEMVLPDERNDLVTDFNKYHGDIFLSNFRHKASHLAYMTMGEINYMIGVNAPDTFSRHYCDYSNDFLQEGMVQKLGRWDAAYAVIVEGKRYRGPAYGELHGSGAIEAGPFLGVAEIDLIVENARPEEVKVFVSCTHGFDVIKTVY